MKTMIISTIISFSVTGAAAQCYLFNSNPPLKLVTSADDWYDGLKGAARTCYQTLTKGKYPGAEEGLKIIDICANPRRCK